MKNFKVAGACVPSKHYMVDISNKITQIKKLIDSGSYFTINRARQYGKTTTLYELRRCLADEYTVVKISFEGLGDETFASPEEFCPAFVGLIVMALRSPAIVVEQKYINEWEDYSGIDFNSLSRHITKMCRDKKIVLMIDEVDKTSNNRVFVHFLSMLRNKYQASDHGDDYTFHSVILAGVYDIKNIKLKMIREGLYAPVETETKINNSLWNIAVNFTVDMSFSPTEIATMLKDYEAENSTGVDIIEISEEIYKYTSGYPFMVSRICQCIDEELNKEWTLEGIQKAVQILLNESNMLFDDLKKNIEMYPDLEKFLREVLFQGENKTFNIDNSTISLGYMFGYLKSENGRALVSNKIFEMRIYNYFITENENSGEIKIKPPQKSEIVENGRFNMELFLRKFAQHYTEIFKLKDERFLESHGGLLFLTYLKSFINGHGFCHIESQTNDFKIDIIVDYESEQFIIELKRWYGPKAHEEACNQLVNYLTNQERGYRIPLDF